MFRNYAAAHASFYPLVHKNELVEQINAGFQANFEENYDIWIVLLLCSSPELPNLIRA